MQQQDNITFTINHHSTPFPYEHINNIPYDTEILEIERLFLGDGEKFDNLPTTLKEININNIFINLSESPFPLDEEYTLKKWIKFIFPKIPFGCKISYYEHKNKWISCRDKKFHIATVKL
jgi:hypothetical protein